MIAYLNYPALVGMVVSLFFLLFLGTGRAR